MQNNQGLAKYFKEKYPSGTRIRLNFMSDPYSPVESGALGTVDFVDDMCTVHMKWDNGRTLGLVPGEDSFTVVQQELKPLKLYMPLSIDCYERNRWGDMEDEPTEIDSRAAVEYEDSIYAALIRERMQEEKERGIMNWYHDEDGVNEKVHSAVFSLEKVHGRLYGTVECEIKGELTDAEGNGDF